MKEKRKKKGEHTPQGSTSSSKSSRTTVLKRKSTSVLESPAAKKRKDKQKKDRGLLLQDFFKKSKPKSTYTFKDATIDLAASPEKLELHPTKTAPTLAEVEDKFARQKEHEKLKFFSVPIKMYEADDTGQIDLAKMELSDEDRKELERYGSRVVMSQDGRVAAMEVQQDIMNQYQRKRFQSEICQCTEKEYEISQALRTNSKVRRLFMAKVLSLEVFFRLPSLVILYYQKEYAQLHDFIYQQNLLIFFMIAIVQGTRLAGIYFSEVGRYEPCKTIITVLTAAGYCMTSVLMTAILQQYSTYFVEYKLYDDPVSLETLQLKQKTPAGSKIAYPYVVPVMLVFLSASNLSLALVLAICVQKVLNELGNGFLLIIFLVNFIMAGLLSYLVFVVNFPLLSPTPLGWDRTQILFSFLMTNKWAMWRFYMLQQVVRGKSMKVTESLSQFVALNFAI